MKKVLILTHTDMDGFFSGAICKRALRERYGKNELSITVREWTYSYEKPKSSDVRKKYDMVVISDLMPGADFMIELQGLYDENNLLWFDHHSIPDSEVENRGGGTIKGLRTKMKECGAMMCWKYFYPNIDVPAWLEYLSSYDAWNEDEVTSYYWRTNTLPMYYYFENTIKSTEDADIYLEQYFIMSNDDPQSGYMWTYNHLIEGRTMMSVMYAQFAKQLRDGYERVYHYGVFDDSNPDDFMCDSWTYSFEKVGELKVFIVNTQFRSSIIFNSLPNKDDYDAFIVYNYTGKKWKYSMYSTKDNIECNKIVIWNELNESVDDLKKFHQVEVSNTLRFRGHKGAAGSVSDDLLLI